MQCASAAGHGDRGTTVRGSSVGEERGGRGHGEEALGDLSFSI